MVITVWCLILAGSYLMGSLATAIWVGKGFFRVDIRQHGSGNAGATNVLRVLGWKPALAVTVIDMAKGFLPTWYAPQLLAKYSGTDPVYPAMAAGCAAVAGHVWTVFGGFRGGKGVATAGGMFIALFPAVLPVCLVIFALLLATTRYVSLASMGAAASLPATLFFFAKSGWLHVHPAHYGLSVLLALFILYTHRANIGRLRRGQESRIGQKAAPKPNS